MNVNREATVLYAPEFFTLGGLGHRRLEHWHGLVTGDGRHGRRATLPSIGSRLDTSQLQFKSYAEGEEEEVHGFELFRRIWESGDFSLGAAHYYFLRPYFTESWGHAAFLQNSPRKTDTRIVFPANVFRSQGEPCVLTFDWIIRQLDEYWQVGLLKMDEAYPPGYLLVPVIPAESI